MGSGPLRDLRLDWHVPSSSPCSSITCVPAPLAVGHFASHLMSAIGANSVEPRCAQQNGCQYPAPDNKVHRCDSPFRRHAHSALSVRARRATGAGGLVMAKPPFAVATAIDALGETHVMWVAALIGELSCALQQDRAFARQVTGSRRIEMTTQDITLSDPMI